MTLTDEVINFSRELILHAAESTHDWLIPFFCCTAAYLFCRHFLVTRWDDVLYKAVREGNLPMVQKALRSRANVEIKVPPRELTPLMIATLQNNVPILAQLLAAGAQTEARDEEGRTSLMLAAQKGHVDIVHALLAKGADPTAKSSDGWTALIIACYAGQTEIVHILLARCADVKWRTRQGMNALAIAVGQHHMPGGRMKIIKMLLSNDAKVDSRTLTGWTSLIKAAYGGHDDVCQLLLVSGADVNAEAQNGFTALIAAAQNGWIDAVQLLLEKGANVNARTSDGSTALIAACNGGYTEIADLLHSYGANLSVEYKNGSTALMAATCRGHIDVAFSLIEREVDIHAKNKDGWTALMVAVDRGRLRIATRLLEQGASANEASSAGWTSLMSACQHGYEDIVALLIAHKAECNVSQQDGWSPLLIATSGGWEGIVKTLIEAERPAHVDGHGSCVVCESKGRDTGSRRVLSALPDKRSRDAGSVGGDVAANRSGSRDVDEPGSAMTTTTLTTTNNSLDAQREKEHVPTPLIAAVSFGYTSIAAYLLSKHADRRAQDALGRTCLEIAMATRQPAMLAMLVDHGFSAKGLQGLYLRAVLVRESIFGGSRLRSANKPSKKMKED